MCCRNCFSFSCHITLNIYYYHACFTYCCQDGSTALHILTKRDDIEVASTLIENGVDIDATNEVKINDLYFYMIK